MQNIAKGASARNSDDDQPWVDFPIWDEPLSKIPAPVDISAARWKLAQRFNARPPEAPAGIRELQIDRAWRRHHRNGGGS
jgi:hypothetical protein